MAYSKGFPTLASMGNILSLIYAAGGAITGVLALYFLLIRPESNNVKVIGAIVLVVVAALNAIMLLTAGLVHFNFHAQYKEEIMSACLTGVDKTTVQNVGHFDSILLYMMIY
jgi:hypothetical protein